MDVTRSNFGELLPSIKTAIADASFITIDGEFTGLNSGDDTNHFDTPAEYYVKQRRTSKQFLLIQLGVCIFRYDKEKNIYKHRCYNFYAFPKPHNRYTSDTRFLCQSSSIDFLATQGFDFNKLFRDGIPYLTQLEEFKLREQLEERHKARENTTAGNESFSEIPIPPSDQGFINDICNKIEVFLESDEDELILDRCNAFLRKLVYQTIKLQFPDKIYLQTRTLENRNIVIVALKCTSEEERIKRENERQEKEIAELEASVGLSRVMQCIADSGKLVIGHNMLLDIMHIVKQFFAPLPESYSDFKELMKVFPRILDTKTMSNMPPFKDQVNSNVLSHLLSTLSESPFSVPQVEMELEGHGYSSAREHEAGYDAYVTGLCFLSMAKHMKLLDNRNELDVKSKILSPFINRLFLMKLQDQPYINLAGADIEPPRDHVFHVTFPKEWKISDINQLFIPYGSVFISWLSDTSAFVALHKRDQSSIARKVLGQLKACTVIPYKKYKKQVLPKYQSTPKKSLLDDDKKSPALSDKRYSPENNHQPIRKRKFDTNDLNLIEQPEDETMRFTSHLRMRQAYALHQFQPEAAR